MTRGGAGREHRRLPPPRSLSALLVAAALLPAPLAARLHEPAPPGAIRVVLPRDGTQVVAGSSLQLDWEPGEAFGRLGPVEEWEVFLSLDGGQRFALRLTPHLDLARRRVVVRLPEIPSADARLLWRVGDERRELEYHWPGRLTVLPAPSVRLQPRSWSFSAGERARSGSAPVWAWVEGERDGSGWREVEGRGGVPQVTRGSRVLSHDVLRYVAEGTSTGPRIEPPPAHPSQGSELERPPARILHREPSDRAAGAVDVRRLMSRWNE